MCAPGPVTVIGGGNSAGQAAVYLAQQGSPVTIAIRGADLASSMSSYLIDRIEASPAITVAAHTEVVALHGDDRLEGITLRDNRTGDTREVDCDGLFSFIGAVPFTDWLGDLVELDDKGFVLTDADLRGEHHFIPLPFETSLPGIFAAGDVRRGLDEACGGRRRRRFQRHTLGPSAPRSRHGGVRRVPSTHVRASAARKRESGKAGSDPMVPTGRFRPCRVHRR